MVVQPYRLVKFGVALRFLAGDMKADIRLVEGGKRKDQLVISTNTIGRLHHRFSRNHFATTFSSRSPQTNFNATSSKLFKFYSNLFISAHRWSLAQPLVAELQWWLIIIRMEIATQKVSPPFMMMMPQTNFNFFVYLYLLIIIWRVWVG